MDIDGETLVGPRKLLVVYADISGSTRLFEEFGDTIARDACAACIEVLTEVVERLGGRVAKTIGDEILAVFNDPAKGVMAGTDMQGAVRQANEDGRFKTGDLRIKVGMHFGMALEEEDDVVGEAPTVAQQVIKLAKADQVLSTADTLEAVPPMFRAGCRFHDCITMGGDKEYDVHELIWEVSGLTQAADTGPIEQRVVYTRMTLEFAGETAVCDAEVPSLTLGRVAGNDLVIPTDLTSRQHAEVSYRRGRFHIADNSANGTLVVNEDGATVSLRREQMALRGSGRLCMGGTLETNPDGVVTYNCE
jgi:class 3 adenylate cyclase